MDPAEKIYGAAEGVFSVLRAVGSGVKSAFEMASGRAYLRANLGDNGYDSDRRLNVGIASGLITAAATIALGATMGPLGIGLSGVFAVCALGVSAGLWGDAMYQVGKDRVEKREYQEAYEKEFGPEVRDTPEPVNEPRLT